MATTLRTDGRLSFQDAVEFEEQEEPEEEETKAWNSERNGGRSSEGNSTNGKHSGGKRGRRKRTRSDRGKRSKANVKKDAAWKQNSRSRRLVANARERSRIHILSDAFENLRRAVPSYSQDQKLSKLAILKLATYYISALANLAESDTSARSLRQFAECVAHCTQALQTEGRTRRKQF